MKNIGNGMTAEEYAQNERDKYVGQKVYVYSDSTKDEPTRIGYVVGTSQIYNSSFCVAFDSSNGLRFEHIHDEMLRGEDGKFFTWVRK